MVLESSFHLFFTEKLVFSGVHWHSLRRQREFWASLDYKATITLSGEGKMCSVYLNECHGVFDATFDISLDPDLKQLG